MLQASAVVLLTMLMAAINLAMAITAYFDPAANKPPHLNILIAIGFSTILIFYVVHFIVYFSWRLARGSEAVRGFASSEINFISAVIALLYFLNVSAFH